MHSSMLRTRTSHPAMQACGAPHVMLQQRPGAVACPPAVCVRPAAPSAALALALAAPRVSQARSRSTTVCAGPPVGPSISAVSVLPAAANAINLIGVGHYKANIPPGKTFLLGILAGVHISFGGFLMLSLGGNMPGLLATNPGLFKLVCALVFPVGLLMVIIGGAELYTGNAMTTLLAYLDKQASLSQMVKNLSLSWSGNLVGSLLMACAVVASGVLAGNEMPVKLAVAKTAVCLDKILIRAVLANFLVCVAVFNCYAASSLPGKVLGLWPCITAFVAIGLEHSVANMFLIPVGMLMGAKVSIADFFLKNLIPVTIGNTMAGIMMASIYHLCYARRE